MDKANKDADALKLSYNPAKNMDKELYALLPALLDSLLGKRRS
jgi:hypothetical protein